MSFVGLASNSDYFEYLEKCKQLPGISIELSSICNFHCYYCNHPKLKRKKEFINHFVFASLVYVFTGRWLGHHYDGNNKYN